MTQPLEVIPLGGVGEFGMNMMLVRYGDDMIAIDAGLMFPEAGLPGVDFVVPDMTYVADHKDAMRAVVLTHGHEDHIGALPFLLKTVNVPVYGTRFTLGLVESRLEEHELVTSTTLHAISPRRRFTIGPFEVEPIRVSHSLVDCVSLAIGTPAGTIVHTGDFKVDETPVCGSPIDLDRFREIGQRGVLALFSDSTNAEVPGRTASERSVIPAFEEIFETCDGKLVVSCFSSSIHRLQIVLDLAWEFERNVELADSMSFLDIPDGLMIAPQDIKHYANDELVVIASGCQGEPVSAMARIAVDAHKQVSVAPGDTVVLSARMIPGNERSISRMMGHLFRKGATVVDSSTAAVHVSGHPKQDDLAILIEALRPTYLFPIHGEARQLYRFKEFAVERGLLPGERVVVTESGDVIQLDETGARVTAKVLVGRTLIDSTGMEEVAEMVVRDRRHLSYDGVVVPVVMLNPTSGAVEAEPEVVSIGFIEDDDAEMRRGLVTVVEDTIRSSGHEELTDEALMKEKLRLCLKRHIQKETGRRPVIVPIVLGV